MSLLHFAIMEHNTDQFDWLLKQDTEIEAPDEEGNTPLMLAVIQHLDIQRIQTLLNRGASLHARNKNGMTPLMLALDHHWIEVAQRFLASLYAKGEQTEVDAQVEQGRLALFFAVFHNDAPAVESLLDAK